MSEEPFLDRIVADDRAALLSLGRRNEYPRGQVLFFEGDPGHDVLLLLEGQVKVSMTSRSGREVILDVIDPGWLLGELSAIDAGSRSATVTVVQPAVVRVIPVAEFVAYLESHPRASTEVVRMVAARLRQASQRQLEFGASDALGRLCSYVVDMAERYGDETGVSLRVTLPLSQTEIASMTGLSREAVVKGLRALRALEWIDSDGRDVRVLDRDALLQRAERES